MHSPPSVCYPVGRSRTADGVLMLGWMSGAICAAGLVLVSAMSGTTGWRCWVPCGVALLAGLSSWHFRRHAPTGRLALEDGCWSWTARAGDASTIECPRTCLDLQRLMLLRIGGSGRAAQWLWVDREAAPSLWRDLRRALWADGHAQADRPTPPGGRVAAS